jgi:hypothetical protein
MSHYELSAALYERSRAGHMQRRRHEIVAAVIGQHARSGPIVELGCGSGAERRVVFVVRAI